MIKLLNNHTNARPNKTQIQRNQTHYTIYKFNVSSSVSSKVGINYGLTVRIDKLSNQFGKSSSKYDFNGIVGVLSSPNNYPSSIQEGFILQPGFHNLVAISAQHFYAADNMRILAPIDRNCYFPDENYKLNIFKNYSQKNCILNCRLKAMEDRMKKLGFQCRPYNFFLLNIKNVPSCDPFQSEIFWKLFASVATEANCSFCLPDCVHTKYKQVLSWEPFRNCDEKNFVISPLCSFNLKNPDMPFIFQSDLMYNLSSKQPFFKSYLISNSTKMRFKYFMGTTLDYSLNGTEYNAFLEDIAIATFFFDSSTVLKFKNELSQTWPLFLANAAGIFGLFIGITLTTFMELIWLLRIIFLY